MKMFEENKFFYLTELLYYFNLNEHIIINYLFISIASAFYIYLLNIAIEYSMYIVQC